MRYLMESRMSIFKKLFGPGSDSNALPPPPSHVAGPYPQNEANFIYQLLFCDDPTLFRPQIGIQPVAWQTTLLNAQPDAGTVRKLAADATQDSRVRMLAYNWLRQNREPVPVKQLLGAIIEVPLPTGLDVLAAYADGGIRYINQTGRFTIFESAPAKVAAQAAQLLSASRVAITHFGPLEMARWPAPKAGKMRMTFLVSDGLYVAEGPWPGMDREPIAGPVIAEAGKLLNLVVEAALAGKRA